MIYVVIIGALIFSVFISLTGIAEQVSTLLASVSGNRIVSLLVMAAVLLLLGSVLDGLALMLLTTPILLPIIQQMGLSPIWFGIFLVRAMEIGFVHPPIGMNLFVIHGIAKDVSDRTHFPRRAAVSGRRFRAPAAADFLPALVLALPKALGQ